MEQNLPQDNQANLGQVPKKLPKITAIALVVIVLIVGIGGYLYSLGKNEGSATLAWNANTESDLAGYKIYYGAMARTGGDPKTCAMCGYASKIDAGKVITYTINKLLNNQTYYFSITSYDASGNESVFSPELKKTIGSANFWQAIKNGFKSLGKK